jgi:hypothetical protein
MSSTEPLAKPNSSTPADPAALMASFWSQWLEQSSRGTQALLEVMQVAGDPQQIQRRWLEAVSASLDGFMRTPAFLELVKTNLKAVTDLKSFQDSAVQDAARQVGIPTAADITGLYERLHSTEQVILSHLQRIEERIMALESKQ